MNERGYHISLPPGWVSVDVHPQRSPQWRAQLLDAAERDPEIARHRDDIDQILTRLAADARRANVTFCAAWFTVVDDALPMQASLTVTVVELGDATNDVNSIIDELAGEGRDLSVVALAGTQAVRSRRVRDEGAPNLIVQHYVPHVARERIVAILTFATPTTPVFDELAVLFDDIADSFRFSV